MLSVYSLLVFFLLAPTITHQNSFSSEFVLSPIYNSRSTSERLVKVIESFLSQQSAEINPVDNQEQFCDTAILGDMSKVRDILDDSIFRAMVEFSRKFSVAQLVFDLQIQRKERKSLEDELQSLVSRRFSVHCSNAVIFPENEKSRMTSQNLIDQVKSRNINPRREFIHYIFLGEKNGILRNFEERAILRLKYKTGIFLEDASVYSEVNSERKFRTVKPNKKGHLKIPKYSFRWCSICGRELRLGIYKIEPYVIFDENKKPIKGHAFNSAMTAAPHFNLTLTTEFRSGRFKDAKGNWSGFVLEIIEGYLDIWFCLAITNDRIPYLDFSPFVKIADVIFYVGHPKVKVDWAAILYAFSPGTWTLILLSFICAVPVFFIQLTVKMSKRDGMKNMEGLFMAIILPFCALLQESRKVPFRARVLYGIFLFYSINIAVFYNSNLISYLSFPQRDPVPLTFHQLAQRKDYTVKLTSLPGSASDIFFQQVQSPTFVAIRERLIYDRNFIECLVTAALDKKTACISWPIIVDSMLAKNLTLHPNFHPLKESDTAFAAPFSVSYPKYSMYSGDFNRFIRILRDTGHFTQWKKEAYAYRRRTGRKWMLSQKDVKTSNYKKLDEVTRETVGFSKRKPFGLLNFVLCFASLIVGHILGALSFFFELAKKVTGKWLFKT